ncbi:MAG: DUF3310 domain-containing protein [Phascolarctobacterium sp.]|nr:DUF3310 domain-containing protein [Phascolarctobacterium sp.]
MNEKGKAERYCVKWLHPVLGFKKDYIYACSETDVKKHIHREFEGAEIIEVIECGKQEQPKDNVNHPSHYVQGGIECIDAIKAAVTGLEGIEAVCTANVIKYIWRWKHKNGVEDLRKSRWYLERLIKELEESK